MKQLFPLNLKGKRSLVVVLICLLLVVAYGFSYVIARKSARDNVQDNVVAQGPVIQVAGDTIVLRVSGADQLSSDDDQPKTFRITESTKANAIDPNGSFAQADPNQLRIIGAVVVVRTSSVGEAGVEDIVEADIVALPSLSDETRQ